VLELAAPTEPGWAERALAHLDELLLDHAHCERKAAGTAVNLLFRYPEHGFLQEPLARLAREELAHFEEVLRRLAERGIPFGRQRPSPYGGKLKQHMRDGEPARLIDTLLVCALIEARSCERFWLLAAAAERGAREPALARWYRGLLDAEARHHRVYVELASRLAPAAEVGARLAELALAEAAILAEPPPFPRLHT
jgi:tRNA 2-(methylsulfanyl)-N6-isopentenyladenosine37 hydroxylase